MAAPRVALVLLILTVVPASLLAAVEPAGTVMAQLERAEKIEKV